MELYDQVAHDASRRMTLAYSTSFGLATRLLSSDLRGPIYDIYGLVRLADEIVDTYRGLDSRTLLDNLEQEVQTATERGYSTNPIVHAFARTAATYRIGLLETAPFFVSMRSDLTVHSYDKDAYDTYIYGSAEVVGLMCLRVFCAGDNRLYQELEPGAKALGAAFQKVNFLRDLATDAQELDRSYFPGITASVMNESDKSHLIDEIEQDFALARKAIDGLPAGARPAVLTAYRYYRELLHRIKRTPVEKLRSQRLRVPLGRKVAILVSSPLVAKFPMRRLP